MNRRGFLIASAATLAGGSAALALHREGEIASVQALLARLESWRGLALKSQTAWSPAQTLNHLAQSVEYSMIGYPEAKPPLFQRTAGRAAFEVFAYIGAMRHSLTEPIPGAPALAADGDPETGLARLCAALTQFSAHQGSLAPHFAFGPLSHAEYAAAHVLHVENHLQQLGPA